MKSIRLRGRSLGSYMASGPSAMLECCVVSTVSLPVCAFVFTVALRANAHVNPNDIQSLSTSWSECKLGRVKPAVIPCRVWVPGAVTVVVSNHAVSVHALPLILSRLLAPPITSYSRLPVPLLSGGRLETGASASCLFTLLIAPVVSFH